MATKLSVQIDISARDSSAQRTFAALAASMRSAAAAAKSAAETAKNLKVAQDQAAQAAKKQADANKQAESATKALQAAQRSVAAAMSQLSHAASGASQAMHKIGAQAGAMDRLRGAAQGAASAMGHLRNAAAGAATGIGSIGSAASSGISALGGLASKLASIAAVAGTAGGALIAMGIKDNAEMEQTKTAFTTLLGSANAAAKMLKQVQAFGAATPFEFPELASTARTLLAMGTAASDVIPTLTDVGDAVSALGLGSHELQSIAVILGQIRADGRASAGDLGQLAERGIPVWKIFSEQLGISQRQVRELVSKGLLPSEKAIAMLRKGMHDLFGGGMQAQSRTFLGLFSTLKDNIGTALRAFTGPLFEQARSGLQVLVNLTSSPAFLQFATTLGEKLGAAVSSIAAKIGPMVTQFSRWASENRILELTMNAIASALSTLGSVFSVVLPIVIKLAGSVAPIIKQIADWLKKSKALSKILKAIEKLIKSFGKALDKVLPIIEDLFEQIADGILQFASWIDHNEVLERVLVIAANAAQGLWRIVIGLAPSLGSLFLKLLDVIEGVMQWAQETDIINKILPILTGVIDLLKAGLEILDEVLLPIIEGFIDWATESGVLEGALAAASTAVRGLDRWMKTVMPTLSSWANEAARAAANVLGIGRHDGSRDSGKEQAVPGGGADFGADIQLGALQELAAYWQSVVDLFNSQVTPAWNNLLKAIQPIRPQLQAFGLAVGAVVLTIFAEIGRIALAIPQALANIGAAIGQWFFGKVQEIAGYIALFVDLISGNWEKLEQDLSIIQEGINKQWAALWSGIVGLFTPFWNALVDIATHGGNDLFQIFMWLYNALVGHSIIPDLINGIVSWFAQLPGRLGALLQTAVNTAIGKFNNLASSALQSGKNIVQSLINGLNAKLGELSQTAANVASTIASWLPHSPAERGPLKYIHDMMPSMVSMLAADLKKSTPQLNAAMNYLISPLAVAGAPAVSAPAPISGGGTTIINIAVDAPGRGANEAREIAVAIEERLARRLRGSGNLAVMTSGGRSST